MNNRPTAMPENRTLPGLTCIGSLLVDDIAKPLQILHAGASNPVRWEHQLGGVACNVARAASLCEKTTLISAIGNDMTHLLKDPSLQQLTGMWIEQDRPNDRYTAVLTEEGDLFVGLATTELAQALTLADIQPHIADSEQAYAIDANLSQACLSDLVEHLRANQPKALIAALPISPEKATKWRDIAQCVDLLFCNRREAAALSDQNLNLSTDTLIKNLVSIGFSNIVLTDAANPVVVMHDGILTKIDVPASTMIANVNGAGDALAGATLSHFLKAQDLTHSVIAAGLPAARCVLAGLPVSYPCQQPNHTIT